MWCTIDMPTHLRTEGVLVNVAERLELKDLKSYIFRQVFKGQ